jgi:hypothetical protein
VSTLRQAGKVNPMASDKATGKVIAPQAAPAGKATGKVTAPTALTPVSVKLAGQVMDCEVWVPTRGRCHNPARWPLTFEGFTYHTCTTHIKVNRAGNDLAMATIGKPEGPQAAPAAPKVRKPRSPKGSPSQAAPAAPAGQS